MQIKFFSQACKTFYPRRLMAYSGVKLMAFLFNLMDPRKVVKLRHKRLIYLLERKKIIISCKLFSRVWSLSKSHLVDILRCVRSYGFDGVNTGNYDRFRRSTRNLLARNLNLYIIFDTVDDFSRVHLDPRVWCSL